MENKKFSGWKVFAGCFLISVLVTGNVSNCLSLYMNPIIQDLGINEASYSLTTLVGTLVMAISTMVWAPKMQAGNMRLLMLIAAVCVGVGFVIYSFAQNAIVLILAATVTNIGMSGVTQMPIATLITMWFNKSRSTVMSLSYAGGGVGGAIFAQIIGRMLAGSGWRFTMRTMGLVAGVAGVLICLFLIKKCPQEIGQSPYEGKPGAVEKPMSDKKRARLAAQAEEASWIGVEKGVAMKTGTFWVLALCLFCIGLLSAGVATHVPNYLVSVGWSEATAANVVSVFSLVAILGGVLGGILFDTIGKVGGILFAAACAAGSMICLLMAGVTPPLAYAFAALNGLSCCLPKLVPAMLVSGCFGLKDYASIFGIINVVFLLGCALGSLLTGILAVAVGYNVAWIMYVVISVLVFITALIAIRGGTGLRAQYPNPVESSAER